MIVASESEDLSRLLLDLLFVHFMLNLDTLDGN